jgi:nucleoid DNA-binding protein
VDLVTYQLSQGKIVQLGELGNFRLSVSSEGRDLEEELTTSAIRRAKVLFSPGAEIRAMLKSATFKKVA